MAPGSGPTDSCGLATVRRLEAAGFRAWPSASVHYDGAWAVRLNASHPAKRLNSVNPLDPADTGLIDERLARAGRSFAAHGRRLTFRISPLAGSVLSGHLDALGWTCFGESLVMRLTLAGLNLDAAPVTVPSRDVAQFIAAALQVQALDPALGRGLAAIIGAIEPETGLFAETRDGVALTTAICVRDGELAGLFEVATLGSARQRGLGRTAVLSALQWAKSRGARTAWLQVEAGNEAALALYRSVGFAEAYRYHYRRPPGGDA